MKEGSTIEIKEQWRRMKTIPRQTAHPTPTSARSLFLHKRSSIRIKTVVKDSYEFTLKTIEIRTHAIETQQPAHIASPLAEKERNTRSHTEGEKS